MEQKTTIMEIKNRATIEEVLSDLKEKGKFIIKVPGMPTSELLKIFAQYGVDYSRVGFRTWSLSPKTGTIHEISTGIVVFRLFCLLSTAFLFVLVICWMLSRFWIRLESYFVSLPLAGGVTSGIILVIVLLVGKFIFKKKLLTLFKNYLGVDYYGRNR